MPECLSEFDAGRERAVTAEDAKKNRRVRKAVRAVNLLAGKNIKVE
jgi:hypothetical protein